MATFIAQTGRGKIWATPEDDVLYSDWGSEMHGGDGNDHLVQFTGRSDGGTLFSHYQIMDGSAGSDAYFIHAPHHHAEPYFSQVTIHENGDDPDAVHVDGITGLEESGSIESFYSYDETGWTYGDDSNLGRANGLDNRMLHNASHPDGGAHLNGAAGNDWITGSHGDDSLVGESGNDTLDGAGGHDTLTGGDGSDTFFIQFMPTGSNNKTITDFEPGSDSLAVTRWGTGMEGTGTLTDAHFLADAAPTSTLPVFLYNSTTGALSFDRDGNGSDNAVLIATLTSRPALTAADIRIVEEGRHAGTALDDRVDGNGHDEQILLMAGNDSSNAGDGNDTVHGNGGNDSLYGGLGSDLLHGGSNNDLLHGAEGYDTLNGGFGRDALYGSFGNDMLGGGDGNDRLDGGYENDTLDGGNGNDLLVGGLSFDTFVFSAALDAGTNVDVIRDFTAGQDGLQLDASVFTQLATGAVATEQFRVGSQAEDADDFLIYDQATGSLHYDADGNGSAGQVLFAVLANRAGLEFSDLVVVQPGTRDLTLVGGSSADVLTGNTADDHLLGGAGDDRLTGAWGRDTLDGEAGNDTLVGGESDDTLIGGDGIDHLQGGAGYDWLQGSDGDLLEGGGDNDSLDGSGSNNTLQGDAGNDTLDGGIGNASLLNGGDGNDLVEVWGSNNILRGGAGNDTLAGDGGANTLSGGAGKDIFLLGESPASAPGADLLLDFRAGTDHIELDAAVFSTLQAGSLSIDAFHAGGAAADLFDRIIYNENTGVLYYDADGNGSGAQVKIAVLDNHAAISAADFIVA